MSSGPPEQPTAPYLDAVVAYGFRGPTRFHVPGHKGGDGADLGLRRALGERALLLDIPQDIEGVDVGPSPTPYERAELLAAKAYGAGRTWFLTNGATQGNHALCLALAPLGAPVVIQRNSHASVIDGLVLSGGSATFVTPEYNDELGIALCVTPAALERALAASPAGAGRVHRLADVLRDGRGRRRLRRGRARRRRAAGGRRRVGRPLRLSPAAARFAARTRGRRGALIDAQDRRQPDAVGDAPRCGQRPDRRRRDRARGAAGPLNEPQLAADGLARRGPPAAGCPRQHAARRHDRSVDRDGRRDRCDPRLPRRRRHARRRAPVSRAGTRCGSSSTSAVPAAPATRSRRRYAPRTTPSPSSPRTRRSCSCSAWDPTTSRSSGSRTTSPRRSGRSRGRGSSRRSHMRWRPRRRTRR